MTTITSDHYIHFICEGWVGNFEQELFSYVFGMSNIDQDHRDNSSMLLPEQREFMAQTFGEDLVEADYGEYGLTLVEVGRVRHPETNEIHSSAVVKLNSEAWKSCDQKAALKLMKALALRFFQLRKSVKNPWTSEGELIAVLHEVRRTEVEVEVV